MTATSPRLGLRATIDGTPYDDPALFEGAAKAWPGAKTPARGRFGTAPTTGEAEALSQSIQRMWRAPRPAPFAKPCGLEPGAEVEVDLDGVGRVAGQVWSLANGGAWVVTGERYLKVSKTGVVLEQFLPGGGFSVGGGSLVA